MKGPNATHSFSIYEDRTELCKRWDPKKALHPTRTNEVSESICLRFHFYNNLGHTRFMFLEFYYNDVRHL